MEGALRTGYRLSLVLPAYNEAAGIAQAVAEAESALARICDDYEILVIDDGSSDQTAKLVPVGPHVRLLQHDGNQGYGAALRTGFMAARFELVAFTDADCQFHLDDFDRLLPLMAEADLAVGYRIDRQDVWRRRMLSGGFNLIVRSLLGTRVRDCDCAFKVFRRDVAKQLLPETAGFFVNAEMLAKARQIGLSVAEAGVRHRPRLHGHSKVSLGQVPRVLATLVPFWWSRVLFAGTPNSADESRGKTAWAAIALLVLVAGMLFFTKLRAPLLEPQEPRYAEIPRQMLTEGSLIVPVLHGEPYLDKPPLLYWSVMASYALLGTSDAAARLVPGLAGVLTVLATYWWGRRVVNARAGLLGALILCLSPGFIYRERMLTFDALLCLWVTVALACLHVAGHGTRLRWNCWLLSAFACGLGLLTKGPVALVLVAGPALAHYFLDPRGARVSWRAVLAYAALTFGLAAPWYVAISWLQPDFAWNFFWTHHVLRFVQPFDHAEPWWFYFPGLILGVMPWGLLVPGLLRWLSQRDGETARQRTPALGFLLLSACFTVAFFSAAGCKRAVYLLPALPPLALSLGVYLAMLLPAEASAWVALRRRGSVLASQAMLLVLLLGLGAVLAAGVRGMVKPWAVGGLAALAFTGVIFAWAQRRQTSWAACLVATFAVVYVGVRELQPAYNRQFALRTDIRSHASLLQAGPSEVVCYPQRWDSVTFYLPSAHVQVYRPEERQRMLTALGKSDETLLLVKSGRALDDLLSDLPASHEFVARRHQGMVTVGALRPRRTPTDAAAPR